MLVGFKVGEIVGYLVGVNDCVAFCGIFRGWYDVECISEGVNVVVFVTDVGIIVGVNDGYLLGLWLKCVMDLMCL